MHTASHSYLISLILGSIRNLPVIKSENLCWYFTDFMLGSISNLQVIK